MSRERDGGRELRQGPPSPLLSEPEREPEEEARPSQSWKKASARRVREALTEPEDSRDTSDRLHFEDEAPADAPGTDTPKGPRPAGRGPAHSPEAAADPADTPLGQSVPGDSGGKLRQESQ